MADAPLTLTFEVTAKVETLRLDGETVYVIQGRLATAGGAGEPLNMALHVPEELWTELRPGDTLNFPLT